MAKVFWSIILLFTLYILSVFFFPKESDEIASFGGFSKFNQFVRGIKTDINSGVTIPIDQMNNGQQIVKQAEDIANKTQSTIDSTKTLLDTKAKQLDATTSAVWNAVDSAKKTADDLYKVRESAIELVGTTEASGSTTTGTTNSGGIQMQSSTPLNEGR